MTLSDGEQDTHRRGPWTTECVQAMQTTDIQTLERLRDLDQRDGGIDTPADRV